MDIYPTLIEVCGLGRRRIDGASLAPLLKEPSAVWDRPALTTYFHNNHSVRSERWRYIRYADGGEELYDRDKDPMEWTNIASNPEHEGVKRELALWLPPANAPDAPDEKGVSENYDD
jgi:arylsulfatase A-like enzyme